MHHDEIWFTPKDPLNAAGSLHLKIKLMRERVIMKLRSHDGRPSAPAMAPSFESLNVIRL